MDISKGLIIWGIGCVVVAVLAFLLHHFYFKRVSGFENCTKETGWGCFVMALILCGFMYLPTVAVYSDFIKQAKDRCFESIKQDISLQTKELYQSESEQFYKQIVDDASPNIPYGDAILQVPGDVTEIVTQEILKKMPEPVVNALDLTVGVIPEDVLKAIIPADYYSMIEGKFKDVALKDLPAALVDDQINVKERVVAFAVKYSKDATVYETLDKMFGMYKIGNYQIVTKSQDELADIAFNSMLPYEQKVKENYLTNTPFPLNKFLSGVVENASVETITGIMDSDKLNLFNKLKDKFLKTFLFIALGISLGTAVLVFIIMCLMREKQEDIVKGDKREHLFVYNQSAYEEINKIK